MRGCAPRSCTRRCCCPACTGGQREPRTAGIQSALGVSLLSQQLRLHVSFGLLIQWSECPLRMTGVLVFVVSHKGRTEEVVVLELEHTGQNVGQYISIWGPAFCQHPVPG